MYCVHISLCGGLTFDTIKSISVKSNTAATKTRRDKNHGALNRRGVKNHNKEMPICYNDLSFRRGKSKYTTSSGNIRYRVWKNIISEWGEVLLLITYRRVHYNNTKNQYYIKEHREIVLYVSYYQLVSHFLLYLSEIEDIFFKILYRIL